MLRFTAILAMLLGVLLSFSVASAGPCGGTGNKVKEAFQGTIDMLHPRYVEFRDNLRRKSTDEWTTQEITEYLEVSLILIYHACNLQLIQNWEHPASLQDAASNGYMPEWPLNPFTWEPIQIRDVSEGFHAGDVASQICPSTYGVNGQRISYQLSIFGPDESWTYGSQRSAKWHNAEWATIPAGIAMTIGYITQTDADIEATREAVEKAEAERAESSQEADK